MKNESKSNIKTKTSKKNVKKETKKNVKKETKKNIKKETKKKSKIVGGVSCGLNLINKYELAFGINPKAYSSPNLPIPNVHITSEFKATRIHESTNFRTFEGCMIQHLPSGFILGGLIDTPDQIFQIGVGCSDNNKKNPDKPNEERADSPVTHNINHLKGLDASTNNKVLKSCLDIHYFTDPPFLKDLPGHFTYLSYQHNISDGTDGRLKQILKPLEELKKNRDFSKIKLIGYMSDSNKKLHTNIIRPKIKQQINDPNVRSSNDIKNLPHLRFNSDEEGQYIDYKIISSNPANPNVSQQRQTNTTPETAKPTGIISRMVSKATNLFTGNKNSPQDDQITGSSAPAAPSAPPMMPPMMSQANAPRAMAAPQVMAAPRQQMRMIEPASVSFGQPMQLQPQVVAQPMAQQPAMQYVEQPMMQPMVMQQPMMMQQQQPMMEPQPMAQQPAMQYVEQPMTPQYGVFPRKGGKISNDKKKKEAAAAKKKKEAAAAKKKKEAAAAKKKKEAAAKKKKDAAAKKKKEAAAKKKKDAAAKKKKEAAAAKK